MGNRPHSQVILGSNRDARTLEITGTPAFFVIGPDGNTTPIFGHNHLSYLKIFLKQNLENKIFSDQLMKKEQKSSKIFFLVRIYWISLLMNHRTEIYDSRNR